MLDNGFWMCYTNYSESRRRASWHTWKSLVGLVRIGWVGALSPALGDSLRAHTTREKLKKARDRVDLTLFPDG